MTSLPTVSGQKYLHRQGHHAIKDGIKQSRLIPTVETEHVGRKPDWIRVRLPSSERFNEVRDIVSANNLATVCKESHCPNIGECWSNGTATLMLMGDVCTRACKFCAVDTGNPNGWLDAAEPDAVANAVVLMDLDYVVLTSVDRDDLPFGGASHYAACVNRIREKSPKTVVEALTPDFRGDSNAIETVVQSGLHVFAHNIETVRRLTPTVRDPRATYDQSLTVLRLVKTTNSVLTKSGLMLGLGETEAELVETMHDLREEGVDFLTLGQYLRPTKHHLPVQQWISPKAFDRYRDWGLAIGFTEVSSGPLVRSSYRADRMVKRANLRDRRVA